MQIVIHRVNTIAALARVPDHFGIEIDVRSQGRELILNHEPFAGGELLENFLKHYHHGLVILNIKEAGIESAAIELARAHGVTDYFLLDVEFPYIHRAARAGVRQIAMRYSEEEAIETVQHYRGRVDWVWIDTITRLPLDRVSVAGLAGFRTCLVCPERWGRPEDIPVYARQMTALEFTPDAVMTALPYAETWTAQLLNHRP